MTQGPIALSQVSAELLGPLKRMPGSPVESAWRRSLVQLLLGLMPAAKVPGVRTKRLREVGAGARLYLPDVRRGDGALLWIHGGGYVIGASIMDDGFCASTAASVGVPVLSVDYRLAPRHRFPAALDDCHAAWAWLQAAAPELGVDPGRIAIGGQSAGGGLAAGLVQRVHDGAGPRAAAQWLFCPMLDDRTAARRELDGRRHLVWDNRKNTFGWSSFLGADPGASSLPPYASAARRQDLAGLPRAWIGVGDIDLFFEEDRDYADRLRAAGVEIDLVTAPGAPHGFESWASGTALAKSYIAVAQRWLADTLSSTS
jgi:acetyl esterase/lipase